MANYISVFAQAPGSSHWGEINRVQKEKIDETDGNLRARAQKVADQWRETHLPEHRFQLTEDGRPPK
jgi:hypothetical protein